MKSADVKPTTASKSGPGKPFFTGAGEAVQEQGQRPAFFKYGGKGGRKGDGGVSAGGGSPSGGGRRIQAKLNIGKAGDSYEKEADATADKVVMRLAQPSALVDGDKAPAVQKKCAKCEQKERMLEEQKKEAPEQQKVQRKPIFDSNAEPPPGDTGGNNKGGSLHEGMGIRRCEACDGKQMVQKSGLSGASGSSGANEPASAGAGGGDVESKLNGSKGGGHPLPDGTREQMESSMGADFSGVRVHTDSNAVEMSNSLQAHAFTHGNDIYFNSGKYDPQHSEGQHLLAHELTHTVQQGAAVRKKPESVTTARATVMKSADPAAPQVQRGVLSFVEDVGGDIASGVGDLASGAADLAGDAVDTVGDVAGDVADAVSDLAGDVKDGIKGAASYVEDKLSDLEDAIEQGLDAVIDFIKDLINKVKEYISRAWEAVKSAVKAAADSISETFKELVDFFKHPLSSIAEAMEDLDPQAVESGWQGFIDFVAWWWGGFKATGGSVLKRVSGLWDSLDGYVSGFFDQLDGIVDSRAFSVLPDSVKSGAQALVDGFRSFWGMIERGWNSIYNGISSAVYAFFRRGEEFLEKLRSLPVAKIVEFINKFGTFIKRVIEIWNNPHLLTDPMIAWIADKLRNAPEKFLTEIDGQIAKNRAKKKQANKGKMPKRYSLDDFDISLGVVRACLQKWKQMDIVKMLKDMLLSLVWPPATAKAIGEAWDGMKKDIKEVWDRLYKVESLEDFWTNLMHLTDIIVIIWRFLNTVLGLLYVYLAVLIIIAGGVLGAVFGAGAGVVPGLIAGAEVAADLGEVLLMSFLAGEVTNVGLQYLILATGLNKEDEQETAFNKIADSIIGLVTAGILAILSAIAMRIAQGIMGVAKGLFSKLSELLKDTGEGTKGKGGEHGGGGPDEKGGADQKGDKAGDDKAGDDANDDIDPNEVEEGEAPLEKPLESSADGERKMAMDKDGECEVCASPCDKMRKKYGTYIDNSLRKLIEAIEKKKISNKAKLQQLKPIEQRLRNKLTHLDSDGNLKPNQKFNMAGEYGYPAESDKFGRLSRVHTDELKLSKYDRVAHEGDTPGKLKRDQAGHIIGDRFGGSPELDNLVSQTSDVNLSEFKKLENSWADALKAGKEVSVDIKINYKGSDVRPSSFEVRYKIDGKAFKEILQN